ncbi:hypothetical protein [uncultured Flavobacterium sp.]|uniref:hypothetical protein n=1 Tax=uncultured Flavobacterium sp. TaxID=165435 RepID=UPI0030CA43BB
MLVNIGHYPDLYKINKINYEPNIDYVYEVNFIYATIDLFKNTHKQKPFGYDQ